MTASMWPIFEFIGAFGLGTGLGSWDLIRTKAGLPTQTKDRRSAVILQSLGIVMLILVGSTTYEQHHDSEKRQRDADCQQARNREFSDGIASRAAAQSAFAEADKTFTSADEAWVADQIRVLDASRNRDSLSQADRDRLTDQWRSSLVAKLHSAREKSQALYDLDKARDAHPVVSPHNC